MPKVRRRQRFRAFAGGAGQLPCSGDGAEDDHGVQADAIGARFETRVAAASGGELVHDGKPETEARVRRGGIIGGRSPETPECQAAILGRHPRPLIDHVQLDSAVAGISADGDRGVGRCCVEAVGDQVVEDLLDGAGHGLDLQVGRALADESLVVVQGDWRPRVVTAQDRGGEVDAFAYGGGGVAAGEDKQRLHQPGEPAGLGDGGLELWARGLGDGGGEGLQPEAQRGEWGAQLVGGVSDEPLLGVARAARAGRPWC